MSNEIAYAPVLEMVEESRADRMGGMAAWGFLDDPKRLAFTLARYKFVAKMLAGKPRALEVGCGDAWAARIVRQAVGELVALDIDAGLIESARACVSDRWPIGLLQHDMAERPLPGLGLFDAAYSLDVLEHIEPGRSHLFVKNIRASLRANGVMIVGMPSLESQAHASAYSKAGHINCMTQGDFRNLMLQHFANVFMFSMSDEVVHTGFGPMSHYNLALCC